MNKIRFAAVVGIICTGTMLGASSANAALRSFYWTSDSQSYAYNQWDAQNECFARAEANAYPYAYNTCVQKIGEYACANGTTQTQRLAFGGRPGLYSCTVRVWVQAYDASYSEPQAPTYYPPIPPQPRY